MWFLKVLTILGAVLLGLFLLGIILLKGCELACESLF